MTTKIKLNRNTDPDRPGYTFTDSKGRVWTVTPLTDNTWDLNVPADFNGNVPGGAALNYHALKEVRAWLGDALDAEAVALKEQNRVKSIRHMAGEPVRELNRFVAEGEAARQAVMDALKNPGDLCYQVSWGKGLSEDYRARLARITLQTIEKIGLAEAIDHHLEHYTREVLNNHYRGGSTNEFSNAVDAMKREVVCGYIESLKLWSRFLAAAKELDAED